MWREKKMSTRFNDFLDDQLKDKEFKKKFDAI